MTPGQDTLPTTGPPADVPLRDKVAWLSDGASYPEQPARVDRIETHFAWVFLTDTRAYKLKKPLRIHGADLRTLAERERCCLEELRLNRRLARQTYLAVLPLVDRGGRLALGQPGAIVDWVVEMQRLDLHQMLDARLRAGTVAAADLAAIVRHLQLLDPGAPTEAGASPPPEPVGMSPADLLAGVAARLDEALREVARPEFGLAAHAYTALTAELRSAFTELRPVLEQRARRVREGHGDLRAEHVWLGAPLQIIDALEFDRSLRLLDPAEDLAMLAVDVERLDGEWVRAGLLAAYARETGDEVPARLWRFYLALRAATRAKVALWHLDDPGQATDTATWRARAAEYLALGTRLLAAP